MIKKRKHRVTLRRRIARYSRSWKYAVRLSKPLLIFRTAFNYLYYLVMRKPRLRFMDLALTYTCNLDCVYCSATRLKNESRSEMTVEDYRKVGKELRKNGVLAIQLTGGEPFLREDLEDIIQALGPSRFFISLATNSTKATRERLLKLKKAGLDNICISIDDWEAQAHDEWRKREGTHSEAINLIDMALDTGFTVMVFTVVSHQNVRSESLLELFDYTGRKGVLQILGWAVPTGNWNANKNVLLTDDDLEYMETLHEKYLHVRTDFDTNYFHMGCGAGKEKLYLTPYGDVIPCAFVHIAFGNIFEKPLKDIRERAMKVDWFRKYNSLCLAANDRDFQDKHMSKVFEAEQEPISMEEAGLE